MNIKLILTSLIASVVYSKLPLVSLKIDDRVLDEFNSRLANPSTELWFNQTLTHKGGPDSKKYWQQRYFVNDQFYKPGGPAFLFIGGEGELDARWTEVSILAKAAEKHNGIVYALEHRFYGKSYPKPDLSTKSLQYLSSELAVDDLANFAKTVKLPQSDEPHYDLGKTKWIISGGSYPGNLAAWTRFKHPEVFHGAVASSAPVEAKEDFFEYDQQVQRSLEFNGGKDCLNYYIENFKKIDSIMFSRNRKDIDALKSKFTCEKVSDELFVDALTYVSGTVQYNNNNKPGNVVDYCKSLKLNGTASEKLDDFARDFKKVLNGATCESFVDLTPFKSEKKGDPTAATRQWLYQCCTEFGYWQVAPHFGSSATRSRLPRVPFYQDLYCKNLFGPAGPKRPNTYATNLKYRSKDIYIKNLLFVNGELDPWMPLSVSKSYYKSMPSIIVKGASHCSDATVPRGIDSKEVAEAKVKVLAFIDELLKN
ncbi:peptidase S28 [Neoconidiobolus thromboides FSU 785]|nr:peptidase S28 [Neoconidiobolus thromboides FSU 785]